MAIYLAQFALLAILAIALYPNRSQSRKAIYVTISCLTMVLISSLRDYGVGNDTYQYVTLYRNAAWQPFDSYDLSNYEVGFVALCKLLNCFSSDPRLLFTVCSCMVFGSMCYVVFRESKDVVFSIFFILLSQTFSLYISAMRQAVAFSIVLVAYLLLSKEKRISATISILIAASFHTSALFMFILVPLSYIRKVSPKTTLVVAIVSAIGMIASPVVFNLVGSQIDAKYLNYEAVSGANIASVASLALYCLTACLQGFFCNSAYGNIAGRKDSFLQIVAMMSFPMAALALRTSFFGRLGAYFNFFYGLAFPALVAELPIKERRLIQVFITIIFIAYYLTISLLRPEWFGVVPYSSSLLGIS